MKKVLLALSFGLALNVQASVIDVLPSNNNVGLGDDLTLNVNISGLNNNNASLGVYDLTLNYDSSLFAVKSIQFGDNAKGNQLDLTGYGSVQTNDAGNGWINLFELSFDAADDLNVFQADDFRLFSVIFTALDQGTSLFSINANSIGDAFGNNLALDGINNSQVNVTSVPEPTGIALMGLGVLALGLSRRKRIA
jgi:hypothetical protein